MFDLARTGATAELATYVDQGVPANLTNDKGDSLLMLAAYHGHAELVQALLDRGADANRANDRGQTPLAGAVLDGFDAMLGIGAPLKSGAESDLLVRALLAGGADPAAGSPSAVDTARMFGREDLFTTAS